MPELRKIQCPYCFKIFEHDQVHFRSERMTTGECPEIPERYDDVEDFRLRANLSDPQNKKILEACRKWDFFKERNANEDEKYREFWTIDGQFQTTERTSHSKAPNRARVIDPGNPEHQRYLRKQENGVWLRFDPDGYAVSIELDSLGIQSSSGIKRDGTLCTQRVCPACHNPLPNQYGKNEARFIAVIGTTGAGKTVYLSQLMYWFEECVAKVGLSAVPTFDSALEFRRENPVKVGTALPGSTPPKQFLQPIFYDLQRMENGKRKVYTLVIYDVAGENCTFGRAETWFETRFISYMNGLFLLIDPGQFRIVQSVTEGSTEMVAPTDVLNTIHNCLCTRSGEQCDVPLAICISKSDMEAFRDVLNPELVERLDEDVQDSEPEGMFNAADYNSIAMGLHDFIHENQRALENSAGTDYSCYNYFSFTSLGCEVDAQGSPEGPINPKRIEEPLFWLFHKFGFIDANAPTVVEYGHPCPRCKSPLHRRKLAGDERIVVTKTGLFGKVKETEEYNYKCDSCGCYYN